MKDVADDLAFIVRNSIAYIKELEAELARCKQVCAATAEAWREEAALAEPVQEPVAWIQPDHLQKARRAPFLCRVEPTKRMVDFVPLYTAPPQRKPLTDEEIQELSQQHKFDSRMEKFVRIIERAHGIT